jgi:hypothetical protein
MLSENEKTVSTENSYEENNPAEKINAVRELRSLGDSRPSRSATARWGDDPGLFRQGFVVVPNRFLYSYASLRPEPLSAGEALFILQLMSFKWDRALPFPSYKTIARRMGITDKMARRYAQSLDRKGYLRRQYRLRATNRFDLTGLFEALSVAPYLGDEDEGASGGKRNQLKRSGPRHGPTPHAAAPGLDSV